jgi:DNA-binding cell septation regulator SpoVG
LFAYGYRANEQNLPAIGPLKIGAKFSAITTTHRDRAILKVSSGCHVLGASLPRPDTSHPATVRAGAAKRFACRPPNAEPELLKEILAFTEEYVNKNFTPLSPDTDTSFETWLSQTNYSEKRKVQLREKWGRVTNPEDPIYGRVKSFGKLEDYLAWKQARAINSRSDEFKCAIGPFFKAIESEVYKNPAFIKHVPVSERPNYIMKRLHMSGGRYVATDYTSFEALFTAEIMNSVEFVLYKYMSQHLADGAFFMRLCNDILAGTNRCGFRYFGGEVPATRMSGEMCTSLGNGFANLIFMEFVMKKSNIKCVGVVEGDDGLFVIMPDDEIDVSLFERLGLIIKLEIHLKISTASFCGIIFDEDDLANVTNPLDVLCSFGWLDPRYAGAKDSKHLALLRCKALSYAYQYPGCPVVQALAKYGLRLTALVKLPKNILCNMNGWDKEWFETLLREQKQLQDKIGMSPIGLNTRLLVE